jgi:hypothetical protein
MTTPIRHRTIRGYFLKISSPFVNFREDGSVGGMPSRPSRSVAPPPCPLRAEPSKKVFFSFQKKKIGARKLKNVKKAFLLGGEW